MKTLKIWHAFVLLAGIVWVSASCNKTNDEIKLDFDITVPDDWVFYKFNQDNIVYYALSPLEDQNDTLQESLLITKELTSGATLSAYFIAIVNDLAEDTSFHVVYLSDTTINGFESKKLIHKQIFLAIDQSRQDTLTFDGEALKYFFVRNNYGYVVSFNALVSTFKDYKPVFDTIMASYKFKN
jgi:hypothetical protein